MSSDPRLDAALTILRDAGHQIGDTQIPLQDGDAKRIWIDGFLCVFEDVLKMAEEERKNLSSAAKLA
jgi:hypothetical protein